MCFFHLAVDRRTDFNSHPTLPRFSHPANFPARFPASLQGPKPTVSGHDGDCIERTTRAGVARAAGRISERETTMTTPQKTTKPATGAGRDAQGCFTNGIAGGSGNPFARHVAMLRASMILSVTAQDIIRMTDVLKNKALSGDVVAIKLFLQLSQLARRLNQRLGREEAMARSDSPSTNGQ